MQETDRIRFILNDEEIALDDVPATGTLLDWLRLRRRLTGTKEGCAEGDCGACTVLVGRLLGGDLVYESVNACIRLLGSMNATHVVTVEHLAGADGTLHPVQQALVDHHGSQCGFCTPGFVMSLYGLWLASDRPGRPEIERALQGNLCRCTGYEPIVAAAEAVASSRPSTVFDPIERTRAAVKERLAALAPHETIHLGRTGNRVVVPASAEALGEVLAAEPKATVVAGSTDVGLWVTKQMRELDPVVFINHLSELQAIESKPEGLTIGAGVTYAQACEALCDLVPGLRPLIERIGGAQVRNMGTIGGNIANGSPIGDTPPPLIALGTRLTLRSTAGRRELPLEDYFIAYGKQDRRPGEFVESLFVPAPEADDRFAVYKISKRRDEDISALCGAFRLSLDTAGTVSDARICFGGMAATPKRASHAEAALMGRPWTEAAAQAAAAELEKDYAPLTDWRATAAYRMLAARNLLTRFYLETTGETAQLRRFEEVA
ncbi:xanthine dehydrogenase small subunit [Rhizobium sp. GN54]|uniref:xanthine dehydrogenase small subunit n=1 Tax=Rhizobium sp. GN54 TaxID=2898150 RepID=UPI001E35D462|nr:xanthine dehydrogenase small subunit [Rhizobium sp. GN54]MCD2184249.1 xanthine dehydrogenase small subunit [Rhizobium sp. GN54]